MTAPVLPLGHTMDGDKVTRLNAHRRVDGHSPGTGTLWQRLGSERGPVRGIRLYAAGAVVDTHEGRRIRAIETDTATEHCVSRIRRPHEIAENAYPHAAIYAQWAAPSI